MDYMDYIGIKTLEKRRICQVGARDQSKLFKLLWLRARWCLFYALGSAAGIGTHGYEGNFITINSSINYLNSTQEGTLIAIAKIIKNKS